MEGKIACCLHIVLLSFFSAINEVAAVLWTSLPIVAVVSLSDVLSWQTGTNWRQQSGQE